MTREEAAEILDPETSRDALWKYEGEEQRLDACNEACRIAASALRAQQTPLDRSRWDGCKYCNHTLKNYMYINACGIEGRSLIYNTPEYCPMCGKPLTEKTWAKLERRVGGNDA